MKPAYATIAYKSAHYGYTYYAESTGQPGCYRTGSSTGYSAGQSFADLPVELPLIRFDAADIDAVLNVLRLHNDYRISDVDAQDHYAKPVTLEQYLAMVQTAGVPVETVGQYMTAIRTAE